MILYTELKTNKESHFYVCCLSVCLNITMEGSKKLEVRRNFPMGKTDLQGAQAWKWMTGFLEQTLCVDVGKCTSIICWDLSISLSLIKGERKS